MPSNIINFMVKFPAEMPIVDLKYNIIRASYYGDLEEIKRAVQEYPDSVKLVDSYTGSTALHFSAGLGNYSCVEFLVNCPRIDLFQRDHDGLHALQRALLISHNAICQLLADRMYPYRYWHKPGEPSPFDGPK